MNEVTQCVEGMNGVKEGRCKATLTFYKPMLREQSLAAEFPRDYLGISLLEQPSKYYFIIRGQHLVLEADSSIQTIMEKLHSYQSRESLNFDGFHYQVGDFQLRVGKVVPTSHPENLRGIVMEDLTYSYCHWGKEEKEEEEKDEACSYYFPAPLGSFDCTLCLLLNTLFFIIFPIVVSLYCFRYFGNAMCIKTVHCLFFSIMVDVLFLQVEHLPISSMEKSRQIMEEFIDIWNPLLQSTILQTAIPRNILPFNMLL